MSAKEQADVAQRLQNLTPAQRALLERRLLERRTEAARQAAIAPRARHSPAVLSRSQELLWLLSQVFDDGIAYNAPGAFHLQGPLDVELLQRSLTALTERHEILRTTYVVIDGQPMQQIGPARSVACNVVDLSDLPRDERESQAQRILKEESGFPFDLVNGPVMRTTVIRMAPAESVLMVNLHHIATDGYSRTALFRDLTALYDAFARGEEPALPPLPIQYADYAVWQREWLQTGVADAQLAYWEGKLRGAPSRLELPTDRPRPPVRSYLGDHMSMMLDTETREGLATVARGADATLFVATLALFATLLARYSGQEDVVIGTPFAGRNRTELDSMVGYFINPLALRIDLAGDPPFGELLARTRETTLEAFQNADVPYETIVRATNPERDLSQTPVFQAMIVYHNPAWQEDRPRFEPAGIRCTEISHAKGWSKFDVLLGVSERRNGMNTTWEYSTELFEPATVQRMTEHFRTLAESAATGSNPRLSRLRMLSEAERAKLLGAWNGAASRPAQGAASQPGHGAVSRPAQSETVKDLFEAQVARTPDADAVVLGEERLTYAQLNARANGIAQALDRQGIGPGKLVGISMDKSTDLVAAVLAVMKSGGAYVPLDPQYPADRLQFMLDDAKPDVLLTHAPGGESEENPPTLAGGEDLAYVIYTSGSTGQPKGVMITNAGLVSVYRAYEREYGLRELRAHLQMASPSFDVFTGDVIRALLAGAKLVLCPREVVLDPARVHELIVREGVDAAELVPATAALLFDHVERSGESLPSLKFLAIGGEPWRNDQYVRFRALLEPDTRLVNSYGLTEATMDSTYFEPAEDARLHPGRFVPIGRPLPNTRVYVLDEHSEPQPVGIPGELCVGGAGVARGYLNRPELTAERFVADPFAQDPAARMYRTGDLARWLADGTLEFIGRGDRQLKIRGFRIEPGEIEAALERHPGVRAAAVTDRQDESGTPRLVAYLVAAGRGQAAGNAGAPDRGPVLDLGPAADPGAAPGPEELRAFLTEQLPAYMIPSAWVVLPVLPTTPNGKVDVEALPAPSFDRESAAGEYVAPRTPDERALAEIWREMLDVQEVGRNDNFFALGGHSLLAVRMFALIEERLGVRLPLATLFQSATVAELAGAVERRRGPGHEQPWESVVALRGNGTRGAGGGAGEAGRAGEPGRAPFFLVDDVRGWLIGYQTLVEGLPDGIPVYGLQAPGVDGSRPPIDTVPELAAYYIEQLRGFQPHGPYYFGGFCFSGVVAYEMARQLLADDEEVGMVALIDALPRGTRRATGSAHRSTRLQEFRDGDTSARAVWVRERARLLGERVQRTAYFRSGHLALMASRHAGVAPPRRPWNLVHVAGSHAAKAYWPLASRVRVDYFRPQTGPEATETPWDDVALGGVVLHQVIAPGMSHATITKAEGAPTLVAHLGPALERAMSGAPEASPGRGREPAPSPESTTQAGTS